LRDSFPPWPILRWITITIVSRKSVATTDTRLETVFQGLWSPSTRTTTHKVRCARVASQPRRYAMPSMRPDRIGPSYDGGKRMAFHSLRTFDSRA
jgi:hypothetical protein